MRAAKAIGPSAWLAASPALAWAGDALAADAPVADSAPSSFERRIEQLRWSCAHRPRPRADRQGIGQRGASR
ncbi:hypothetical protein LL965_15390 [Xanthomonas cassavae CFBP 4642]|uniref:Uncharacterized protein n=1 Tax=Xanthomonas cassavae CFBP 4642 TaxID=1219375 RepID=A0ABS8HHC6_9XANT|nr:hypothetical protein [Xanthomonas cassavae]MCC4621400.1 hypothetical protein [Xanthomonas cassavae CFBP 4642]